MSIVIVFAFTYCLIMVLIDISYSLFDPRVKAQYSAAGKKKAKLQAVKSS